MPTDLERRLVRFAETLDREAPAITIDEIVDRDRPVMGRLDLPALEPIEFPLQDELAPTRVRPALKFVLVAAAVVLVLVGLVEVVRTDDDLDPSDTPAPTIPPSTFPPTTNPPSTTPESVGGSTNPSSIPDFAVAGSLSGLPSPRYSADGSLLAIQSEDGQVLVHDATSLDELRRLPCPTRLEPLSESLGTAPDPDRVWDADAASRWSTADLTVLTSASREMCGLTVNRDGTRAVADADVGVPLQGEGGWRSSLWDTTDGSLIAMLPGRSNGFTGDGSTLIMSDGPSVSIVDASTGAVVDTVTDDAGFTILSPDGSRLLRWGTTLGDIDASAPATIYDSRTLAPRATLNVDPPNDIVAIEDPVFDPANGRVVALTETGATIWDASTGEVLLRIPIELVGGRSVYFGSDGLLVAVRNGTHILVFESTTGTRVVDLDLGDVVVEEVVFRADGTGMAAGVTGGARIWTMTRGTAVETATPSPAP